MHAVTCLPAITGAWQHRGGGAFFLNLDSWRLDTTLAHGLDLMNPATRVLDQSRIGPVLCGELVDEPDRAEPRGARSSRNPGPDCCPGRRRGHRPGLRYRCGWSSR